MISKVHCVMISDVRALKSHLWFEVYVSWMWIYNSLIKLQIV